MCKFVTCKKPFVTLSYLLRGFYILGGVALCYMDSFRGQCLGEDRSQQHGMVNMALGCSDRSQLSLQHLLSAGIYHLP